MMTASIPHADAVVARERLASRGWIARNAESFRHLTPPAAATWLGEDASTATVGARAPGTGWTYRLADGRESLVVARVLDATDREQRTELFAGLPMPEEDDAAPFAWAHRALVREGLRIRIHPAADGVPVCLDLRLSPSARVEAPLLVVELLPGARCILLESHDGRSERARSSGVAPGIVQNLHVHVALRAQAELVHLRVACPAPVDRLAHDVRVRVERDARYHAALLAIGSDYHLERVSLDLQGPGSSARIGSALLAAGSALDHQVRVRHEAPRTRSAVEALGLARDAARLVANARTRIAAGCSGAEARQRLCAIPTAGNPRVTLRPHLEIHHDEVKAAHGATFGALPEDALFHARQRGLDERTAKALIVGGLARAALESALPEPATLAARGVEQLLADAIDAHLARVASEPETIDG